MRWACSADILQHQPGDDEWGYEDAGERWLPVHSVESVVSRGFCALAMQMVVLTEISSFPLSPSSLPMSPTSTRPQMSMLPKKSARTFRVSLYNTSGSVIKLMTF